MTSAIGVTPSNKQRRAFTLIEVALAMFIVVLVIGIGLPFATGMGQQSRLREPADELKTLALTARRRAVTEQKTMEILLENHGFVLREAVIADLTSRAVIDPEKDKTEIASYPLPSGVQYSIKRWDETKFATTADARWRFLPTGLCEPITVRLSRDEDYLEFSFNPLTAQTEDESFLFR